jgi:hypothetical protein
MVDLPVTYLTLLRSAEAGEKIGTTGCFAPCICYTVLIRVLLRLLHTGFYFAVQSGGTFDIDYTLTDPEDVVLLEGQGERQGDYILTANKVSMRRHISLECISAVMLPVRPAMEMWSMSRCNINQAVR